MALEPSAVLDALKVVRDPDLNRDIVSLGFIKNLSIDGGRVAASSRPRARLLATPLPQ